VTCGCGTAERGTATAGEGLLRPSFFPGMLLGADDLTDQLDYLTAKARLRNRMLFGAGVVCGLDVVCEPCDTGRLAIRAGYALDCCGHDVVVPSGARVDIGDLLRDLRTRCGDPCDDKDQDARDYGLYVRYLEQRVEPVAAYPTDDSCGGECQPSRVRETYSFLLKTIEDEGHGDWPADRLAHCLGKPARLADIRARAYRLDLYRAVLAEVGAGPQRPVTFDDAAVEMLGANHRDLADALKSTGGDPDGDRARAMTEMVRWLAASIARYDLAGRTVEEVEAVLAGARKMLVDAVALLEPRSAVWSDPVLRSTAAATLAEAVACCGPGAKPADVERRMVIAGLPLSAALRTELFADLRRLREWLYVRLENLPDRADCALATDVGLPLPAAGSDKGPADPLDLRALATAVARLTGCLRRLLADCACRSLQPSCHDCADTDVLLARITLLGCTVQRICTVVRPRVDPSVSPVPPGAWELAAKVCCPPPSKPEEPKENEESAIDLAYVYGLLAAPVYDTDLDELLVLLGIGVPS
jgi:hypothetical protein